MTETESTPSEGTPDAHLAMQQVCFTCKFWWKRTQECRRFPPRIIAEVHTDVTGKEGDYHAETYSSNKTLFPTVGKACFCGEWKIHPEFRSPC